MRYSISNAIPHNPKSKKHPYETLANNEVFRLFDNENAPLFCIKIRVQVWWRQCNKMRTYNSYTVIACYLQYFQKIV